MTIEWAFGLALLAAQVGLSAGVYTRLGALVARVEAHEHRILKLEGKNDARKIAGTTA